MKPGSHEEAARFFYYIFLFRISNMWVLASRMNDSSVIVYFAA